MTRTARQYNYCMDFIKGIACVMVVFIHAKFPGYFGQSVQAVARFAVPFFFMVSGYYYFHEDCKGVGWGGKKIVHILRVCFGAYAFYLCVAVLQNYFLGDAKEFNFSLPHIAWVALFTVPSNVPGQLWFLIALLEVYVIWLFIDLFNARKAAYFMAVVMFLTLISLAQGMWFCGRYKIDPNYYRNGVVEGYAFFTLGYFLHDKEARLTLSNKALITVIIISAFLSIVERFLCGRVFGVHLCSYPLVICLFIYAMKNSQRHSGVIQKIGKYYSMYVYILHIFVWHSFDRLLKKIHIDGNVTVLWIRPFIVLGITLLMSMACHRLFNRKNIPHEVKQDK